MKNIKLHIWFAINIGVLLLFLANVKLLASPIWIVLFFSGILIGKGVNQKPKLDKAAVFYIVGFLALFLLLIFSGAKDFVGNLLLNNSVWLYLFDILLIVMVVCFYVRQINRSQGEHGSNN